MDHVHFETSSRILRNTSRSRVVMAGQFPLQGGCASRQLIGNFNGSAQLSQASTIHDQIQAWPQFGALLGAQGRNSNHSGFRDQNVAESWDFGLLLASASTHRESSMSRL